MLDAFSREHNIKSLEDRLRIGLNEAGVLAVDVTNERVQEVCQALCESKEDAEELYEDLLSIVVDIQQHGPWAYAAMLSNPETPLAKAWFMLNTAVTLGYEKEQDLNDREFVQHAERIEGHLEEAAESPDAFFEQAKKHVLERARRDIKERIFVPPKKDKDGKTTPGFWRQLNAGEKKSGKRGTPKGEGLGVFLPIAIEGFSAGVATDDEGWVYVGAAGRIKDGLLESCGLTKETVPDPRDPLRIEIVDGKPVQRGRMVDMYSNQSGQQVVKRLYPGFLIMNDKTEGAMNLALSIAQAVNDEARVLEYEEEWTEPLRVIQTTEAERDEWDQDRDAWNRAAFLRMPELHIIHEGTPDTTALTRPREDLYPQMLYVRGLHVYLDSLKKKRHKLDRDLTDFEKSELIADTWEKQTQKVEEVRYVNGLIDGLLDRLPPEVDTVIDMAGGAGDLGLGVAVELLARGRKLGRVEVVDPQVGVADFMKDIITWLPFRKELEETAHHTTGILQEATITPESVVVAKHACGTLTDEIIDMWRDSKCHSPVLVAMTCCQDKAANEPSRYGIPQEEWHRLCKESAKTNTVVPEQPGPARDIALRELQRGHDAMDALDRARVENLRRHGFEAELHKTDKFPKGNVIIARRLPPDFMGAVDELDRLEETDPNRFDAVMTRLNALVRGRKPKGGPDLGFGEGWRSEDFAELARRLTPSEEAREEDAKKAKAEAARKREEEAEQREAEEVRIVKEKAERLAFLNGIFGDAKGKIDVYVRNRAANAGKPVPRNMKPFVDGIQNFIQGGGEAEQVRAHIDQWMTEQGY